MRRVVLVTRPEPGLGETMGVVRAQGWEAVACPVMRMHHVAPMADHPCQAMLVTSGQALPFLARQDRGRLLLTVGARTAARARGMGFYNVESAAGNQAALEALCRRKGLHGPGLMLACGRGRHGQPYGADLASTLGAAWFEAYQVRPEAGLAGGAVARLAAGQVRAVLFYSSETVTLFMELCPPSLHDRLRDCEALCLSRAIAERVESHGLWGHVRAGHPLSLLGERDE